MHGCTLTTTHLRSSTEPFVQFLEFNRGFNRQFKVSVAAIMHVSRIVSGSGGTRIMQGLVADTGEPWAKDFNWSTPARDLGGALRDTTLLGIVQIDSAADDMLSGLRAEYDRWLDFRNTERPRSNPVDEEREPAEVFYVDFLGGQASAFDRLRPVLRYFRFVRNCVAHRSSVASPALAVSSRAVSVAASLKAWPQRKTPGLPPLPAFDTNRPIELLPRHAIFCIEAWYEAAVLLNRQLVLSVGVEGLIYLVARRVLFAEPPLPGLMAYKSAEAVIADACSNRYRARISHRQVIEALKPLGVWKDCIKAFEQLYGNPPRPRAV